MNRSKNYLMDWLAFINDSSGLYQYLMIETSYRTLAPQVLFVEEGCSEGYFNGKLYRIKKGNLILIPNNTWFYIQSISKDWKIRFIEVKMPQAMQKRLIFFRLDVVELSIMNYQRTIGYFDMIADRMRERDKMIRSIEYLILSLLDFINVIAADTHLEKQRKKRVEQLFEDFMEELLKNNSKLSRDVSNYARKLCIAPNYLGNAVKTASGKSVQYWINRTTLHKAQEMLGKSDVHIKEIATRLGFEDASSFSRFFRKHTGMTPRAYREEGTREQ